MKGKGSWHKLAGVRTNVQAISMNEGPWKTSKNVYNINTRRKFHGVLTKVHGANKPHIAHKEILEKAHKIDRKLLLVMMNSHIRGRVLSIYMGV